MTASAIGYALFAWWFSTGLILYMHKRTPREHPTYGLVLTLCSGVAFLGLSWSAFEVSTLGAYVAFSSALVVWGWHELVFLFGWLTGPHRSACPTDVGEWERFKLATQVVIHHELALLATAALVVGLTWSGPNQVGTWTYSILWLMRISAKLNIFLGVRNLTVEFLPRKLGYMASYFRIRRINPLMPLSLTASGGVLALLVQSKWTAVEGAVGHPGTVMVSTLLALAAVEHIFLVLPVPDAWLWRWALPPGEPRAVSP